MSEGWNTIESDAGVFTYLLNNLGVKDVQFEELLAVDVESLRRLSPIYGLIFLFKYPSNENTQSDGMPEDGQYDHEATQKLFFAKQTIQNACGTQALLSVLLNKDSEIDIGSPLRDFKQFTATFPAELRGEALSNSELIREVHNSFSKSSPFVDETRGSFAENDDVYHFIAYTSVNDVLYELDGLHDAPISHGPSTSQEFPEKIVPVIQRRISRYPANEIRFNLLAMVKDLRIKAHKIGDQEMLQREKQKRTQWAFENALRGHNFLGFTGELMKQVVAAKLKESPDTYEKWLEDAKKKS
ncbi:hypothetical protein Golomagni_03994 [Golovinomyces magnicellulatus]|nr:hypothetical protein Golomagni_03994 [Golovinomyces magnicellulatus]